MRSIRMICVLLALLVAPQLTSAQQRFATGTVPPPQFTDPQRKQKLAAAFPEIEKLFKSWMERLQPPGAVLGVIVDGELVFVKAAGVREKTNDSPVTGLGVSNDCRYAYVVGHGGGLPGYGSLMRWLPEYGVGLIGMSNQTYQGFNGLFNDVAAALQRTGALQPRVVQPSQALLTAQSDVSQLIIKWDESLANRIAADNLFLDAAADVRKKRWEELAQEHGLAVPELRSIPKMLCAVSGE